MPRKWVRYCFNEWLFVVSSVHFTVVCRLVAIKCLSVCLSLSVKRDLYCAIGYYRIVVYGKFSWQMVQKMNENPQKKRCWKNPRDVFCIVLLYAIPHKGYWVLNFVCLFVRPFLGRKQGLIWGRNLTPAGKKANLEHSAKFHRLPDFPDHF